MCIRYLVSYRCDHQLMHQETCKQGKAGKKCGGYTQQNTSSEEMCERCKKGETSEEDRKRLVDRHNKRRKAKN